MHAKTVLITGGARRIGGNLARHLHAKGHNIVVHYRSSSNDAAKLIQELNASRENSADMVQCDLLDLSSISGVIEHAVSKFGKLDVLVNNASTFYPTPIELITEDFWDDLIGSNLRAPTFLIKHAAKHLAESKGCIINIVDIYARKPLENHPIYCSAKAGLEMLTKSMARDLAPSVRVNGISPGAILWPENDEGVPSNEALLQKIPLARMGEPDDIAKTAEFLIDNAPYISGQIIAVDGGRSVVI